MKLLQIEENGTTDLFQNTLKILVSIIKQQTSGSGERNITVLLLSL
jgi:hypothetical protein